jgi:hypothetical protein
MIRSRRSIRVTCQQDPYDQALRSLVLWATKRIITIYNPGYAERNWIIEPRVRKPRYVDSAGVDSFYDRFHRFDRSSGLRIHIATNLIESELADGEKMLSDLLCCPCHRSLHLEALHDGSTTTEPLGHNGVQVE